MPNWRRWIPGLLLAVLVLLTTTVNAQQLTATLSGTATDQTGARVPGAKVTVTSETTGDLRATNCDTQGFFSVTALIPGRYTVTIEADGFATWKETGVLLNQGDSRTIPNIHLKVGGMSNEVTVIAGQDAEVPVDTAEISATLNNELVDSAVLTGRNAAELIKMMPGITFNNGNSSGSGYNSQTTGTNNGPAGSFSANGTQPYGSTAVILDGANLLDPGNAGTQVANINQDMTDSVKYLSASYGAEYAKGPAILEAFSKSGGQKYHGEAYLYARNSAVGYANDWYQKHEGNPLSPQSFYYVGGNVGGPVVIPGLRFNKNRDKLFFWGGYEKMIQHPYNPVLQMNVPTGGIAGQANPGQLDGDFNNIGVPTEVVNQIYPNAYARPCATDNGWQGCNSTVSPWGGYDTGTVPNLKSYFDPAGAILAGINPKANQTPNAINGWNNFGYSPSTPVNRWEATGKVTYALNENNKIWGSYAYQSEVDDHPIAIWWASPWTIPYPSNPVGKVTANVYLANYTHVFNATTTNEFVFSLAKFVNDNSLTKPAATSRSALGFPSQMLFGGTHQTDQIPNYTGQWNQGASTINEYSFDGGIYGKNSFGKTSKSPAISDTFTKIIRTHSVKAGFYWDTQENLQSSTSDYNGTFNTNPWGTSSTYNLVADMLMARIGNYTETSSIPVVDMKQHQWSIWAQDSWKATPKLTLNIGLRADHVGQWYDGIGDIQVWDPASYDNTTGAPANTGILWHKLSSKIPKSGFVSPLFFYNPRLGLAYDVFGNGNTVVRVGFGTYRYQISSGDAANAAAGPLGSFQYNTSASTSGFYNGYSGLTAQGFVVPQSLNQNGAVIYVDQQKDNKVPYANTYSLGVAQGLPGHTVFQASYVGSMSRNQIENGTNGHISDANGIALGAFFGVDPVTGVIENPNPIGGGGTFLAQHYRPLKNFQNVWVIKHGGYANYNSLQVAAQKQSGNLFLFANFTFGKVLGTRDGSSTNGNGNGPVVDPYSLDANYGPLAYDHTKVLNISFSYKLPKPIHNNAFLAQAINGWELSGYTTYQDGAPFQTGNPSLNATYVPTDQTFTMPNGLQTQGINTSTWYGTDRYENGLQPVLVSDPRKGLHNGQRFNPNAFRAPFYGEHGQTIWPYIRQPGYFGSDLAIFKAFKVTEAQRAEIRVSATNWLNHPNGQFGMAGNADQQLTFNGASQGSFVSTNANTSLTGKPANKVGYRWLQFAAKYYF